MVCAFNRDKDTLCPIVANKKCATAIKSIINDIRHGIGFTVAVLIHLDCFQDLTISNCSAQLVIVTGGLRLSSRSKILMWCTAEMKLCHRKTIIHVTVNCIHRCCARFWAYHGCMLHSSLQMLSRSQRRKFT